MNVSRQKNHAITVSILTLIILAASFTPWGTIRDIDEERSSGNLVFHNNVIYQEDKLPFSLQNKAPVFRIQNGKRILQFQDKKTNTTVNEITGTLWNGYLSIQGVEIPNWLIVIAAILVAISAWVNALSGWKAYLPFSICLSIYGLLHSGLSLVSFATSRNGSMGIGLFLSAGAFFIMLVLLGKEGFTPERGSPVQSLDSPENTPVS
ncbi:MAG: hypothetical protein D6820_16380 [Lentisphaerae bacterium]|nr:MAG: hypothetical protein D6820_16380 [Lentisphaerota bacterium]